MSHRALASAAGVTRGHVGDLECDRSGFPWAWLRELAAALEVDEAWLVWGVRPTLPRHAAAMARYLHRNRRALLAARIMLRRPDLIPSKKDLRRL